MTVQRLVVFISNFQKFCFFKATFLKYFSLRFSGKNAQTHIKILDYVLILQLLLTFVKIAIVISNMKNHNDDVFTQLAPLGQ